MEPFLVTLEPATLTSPKPASHDGEEFLFVLSGQLEVGILEEVHRLEPGDSIYFDSRLEHSLRAVEGSSVRMIVCVAQERRPTVENPMDRAYR